MLLLALISAASAQPASPSAMPIQAPSRFGSLFIDWRSTGEEALARERARLNELAAADAQPVRQARALGDQVGEMVALGDCDGGEQVAREAGDHELVRAVQAHCRRRAAGVMASSGPR